MDRTQDSDSCNAGSIPAGRMFVYIERNKRMESSKDIRDIKYNKDKKNNGFNITEIFALIKKNVRYVAAGMIFLVIVFVVSLFNEDQGTQVKVPVNESGVEIYQIDVFPEVNTLIQNYYSAYAAGDLATLQMLATPISERELDYIALYSQYVEGYENLKFYTKSGLDSSSYLVNVAVDVKFTGVETLAPGLDFFYVRTREDGTLYIDNLYSTYNLKNMDNPLDTSVHSLINQFEQHEDVIALVCEVTAKYVEAVAADANLDILINTTLPQAISDWMAKKVEDELVLENPADSDTEISEVETTDAPVTEVPTTEPQQTETEVVETEAPETEAPVASAIPEGTVIRLEKTINIREKMSTDSDKVGVAYQGEKVTVIMSYADGWTKVKWDGKTGYVRTDLLQ